MYGQQEKKKEKKKNRKLYTRKKGNLKTAEWIP